VRAPASICGVVGIKPTRGRISSGPMVTDSDNVSGLAHEGLMARSVRDIAAFLDIVSGHRPGDPFCAPQPLRPYTQEVGADPGRLRIGVLAHNPAGDFEVDPEIAAATRQAADALAKAGHDVRDGFPEALGDRSFLGGFMTIADVAIAREVERYGRLIGRPLTEDDVEWTTWEMVKRAGEVTGRVYAESVDQLREYAGRVEGWWEDDGWDLLITPTVGRKQAHIGELMPTKATPFVEGSLPVLAFTSAFNASGQPAISLPTGVSREGLPIGVQLVAAYGREDRLFQVARQLEQALPWADRKPALLQGR
jgi:amidase